ncbi:DUF2993 domain-containing protein [Streptomyces phyllanthi]|uniref:DUF2993 domain-containing protein n=1 Tax=Streptomyces phyllanthi TaxID=1803180 RepID=A0A5N8WFJ0_9ACTN|nr:DUF2993 domain-containing protein [Streptomyces phyllanthi]MPY45626.1 DUF2993 domain-containing protein [Streptomyces phyllanthi]
MRTPHDIPTHPRPNPYDELGALDDGPLEEFFQEDETGPAETATGTGTGTATTDADADAESDPGHEADDWTPPNHRSGARRRRKRFAGLPLALKALVLVVGLSAFLVLGDRWAVLYAEHKAGEALKNQLDLSAAPEVGIEGFPFVTQLADDRLDSVTLTVPDVAADRVSLAKVSATAKNVKLDTDGLTSVRGAAIPELDGEVLLSFDDLNRELGASQVTFTGHGRDEVRARGTLPVAGYDLKVRADARIRREGERGIATDIDGMRLDIGELATYRPGAGRSDGLHLTPKAAGLLAKETRKARELLSVPSIVDRLGVPEPAVRAALQDDTRLAELTGSDRFARQAMDLNLIDVAADNPEVLQRLLGVDPALFDALTGLTRPVLADRLSLGFSLPKPQEGEVRLRDVRVEEDGIRVSLSGTGLAVGR